MQNKKGLVLPRKIISLTVSLVFALLVALHQPALRKGDGTLEILRDTSTPPHAAAQFLDESGECLRYLSVYVQADLGTYKLGLGFGYIDRNLDGEYTPGVDRLDVCVNCRDSCGWQP